MFNPDEYIENYQQYEHGHARLKAIKKAIDEADKAGDARWRFNFRYEFIRESVFHCDDLDSIIVFPEMMAVFDENEELNTDDDCIHDLMWSFKYILDGAKTFSNVSTEQIEKLFEEFSERCKKYGFSQRTHRYMWEKFTLSTGNFLPKEEYGKFVYEPEDELKDCKACEQSFKVRCALVRGDEQEAMNLFAPIDNGDMRCAEIPQDTFRTLIIYYISKGRYAEALKYAKRLYSMIKGDINFTEEFGVLLCLYSKVDVGIGINIFERELENFAVNRNHSLRFFFALGAYRLFSAVGDDKHTLHNVVLTNRFELYNENNEYQISELADYFGGVAKDIAAKFDKRNGNSYYTDMVNAPLPENIQSDEDFAMLGFVPREPSLVGVPVKSIPEAPDWEGMVTALKDNGFEITSNRFNEENNSLLLQFKDDDDNMCHKVVIAYQNMFDPRQLRLIHPLTEEAENELFECEGLLLSVLYSEEQDDLALRFQLKMLHTLVGDVPAVMDITRQHVLSGKWFANQAATDVPPVVDYLYGISYFSNEDCNSVWLKSEGLRFGGMRELEIIDADKENMNSYWDLLNIIVKRMNLVGSLPSAGRPFVGARMNNGGELTLSWLPTNKALKEYYEGDEVLKLIDPEEPLDNNAVLFLYKGENADGSPKLARLNTMTEEDWDNIVYNSSFYNTERKNAALTQERYEQMKQAAQRYPDNAFVLAVVDEEEDEWAWLKIDSFDGDKVIGKTDDEQQLTVEKSNVKGFSIRTDDDKVINPDEIYLMDM